MTQYAKYRSSNGGGGGGGGGAATWKDPVADFASLPLTGNTPGDTRVTLDTSSIYTWDGAAWQLQSTSAGGVNSVSSNGSIDVTGTPTDPIVDIAFPILAPESAVGSPSYAFSETGNDTGMGSPSDGIIEFSTNGALAASLQTAGLTVTGTIAASNYPPTGNNNSVAYYDNTGALSSFPGLFRDNNSGGLTQALTLNPDNNNGVTLNPTDINFTPLQNSPNESWNIHNYNIQMDVGSTGFTQGTNGTAVNVHNMGISHQGTGDTGFLNFSIQSLALGNGTDPISIDGFNGTILQGNINDNVTIVNQLRGFAFQPAATSLSTFNDQVVAFADSANFNTEIPGYTSYVAGSNLDSISNNRNYVGYNVNTNVDTLIGNANYFGLAISGNIGTTGTGSFQGISIQPTVTLNNGNAIGINVSMNNVTNYPGVQASLVVQDITYTLNEYGSNGNSITVEYTNTVLAGNEVATFVGGLHIVVSIESGVSTATQVVAALNANPTISVNITYPITGVASNPQVTFAQTNLAGGVNPATKKAAQFDGDVSINGDLSFTGALALGQLNSFAPFTVVSGAGVASIDTLITAPSVAASATITGTDLLAINTAMLLSIGNNATVTSNFLGYAALGLPAVLAMGTGSTIDRVEGAVFAISLDGSATGGTVAEVDLCRALAIPNGVTTVTELKAYEFDLPFGDVGVTQWGFYSAPSSAHNYFAGDVVVGTSDTPTNASVGIELKSTTKAILNPRMNTTQRNALTAVAGMQIYNTDTAQVESYNGSGWSGSSAIRVATVREEQPNGTASGTFSSGSYITRVLNTSEDPTSLLAGFNGTGATAADQFELSAGTYHISGYAPAREVNQHTAKIYNITDAVDAFQGQSAFNPNESGNCVLNGIVTIASNKVFEVQHICQTTHSGTGLGGSNSLGGTGPEIFTNLTIMRIG